MSEIYYLGTHELSLIIRVIGVPVFFQWFNSRDKCWLRLKVIAVKILSMLRSVIVKKTSIINFLLTSRGYL